MFRLVAVHVTSPMAALSSDYERIKNAIRYINDNIQGQPRLEEIANAVGLSPFHFQRLFRRWAGTTPKRFLQFLTVDYAKQMLADFSVLDVSLQLGLSSQARLYDHFLTLEAVTPGQYKTAGQGVGIDYGICGSPFGHAFIAATKHGVCQLSFVDEPGYGEALQSLRRVWPKADMEANQRRIDALAKKIFSAYSDSGKRLHLLVRGTNFQVKVWRSLLQIPPGTVYSYRQIAAAIGQPSASRAVANAIGVNPIAYLIPCHRVIRATGKLGGYHWGVERKHALLGWEAARRENGERS